MLKRPCSLLWSLPFTQPWFWYLLIILFQLKLLNLECWFMKHIPYSKMYQLTKHQLFQAGFFLVQYSQLWKQNLDKLFNLYSLGKLKVIHLFVFAFLFAYIQFCLPNWFFLNYSKHHSFCTIGIGWDWSEKVYRCKRCCRCCWVSAFW